jgi:hypothetical protein
MMIAKRASVLARNMGYPHFRKPGLILRGKVTLI